MYGLISTSVFSFTGLFDTYDDKHILCEGFRHCFRDYYRLHTCTHVVTCSHVVGRSPIRSTARNTYGTASLKKKYINDRRL